MMILPMRPDNDGGSYKSWNNNIKIPLVGENNTGENNQRNIVQEIESLDFFKIVAIQRAIIQKIV